VNSITLPRRASSARGAPVDLPAVARIKQAAAGRVGTRPTVAAFDRVNDSGGSAISAASRSQVCRLGHYISPQPAERSQALSASIDSSWRSISATAAGLR